MTDSHPKKLIVSASLVTPDVAQAFRVSTSRLETPLAALIPPARHFGRRRAKTVSTMQVPIFQDDPEQRLTVQLITNNN